MIHIATWATLAEKAVHAARARLSVLEHVIPQTNCTTGRLCRAPPLTVRDEPSCQEHTLGVHPVHEV